MKQVECDFNGMRGQIQWNSCLFGEGYIPSSKERQRKPAVTGKCILIAGFHFFQCVFSGMLVETPL